MILIDRASIAAMIPHAGAMCLLDGVLAWDETSIRCISHRAAASDNPLRRPDGTLGAACGIEIAAQAMAVHGRLLAAPAKDAHPPARGYLASLRDIRLAAATLDGAPGPLIVEATRLMGDGAGATYRFAVSREDVLLLEGRATVLFEAAG